MEIISNVEVIALNQDPLGVQGYKRWSSKSSSISGDADGDGDGDNDGSIEVWAGDLSGGDVTVVLFNRSEKTQTITAKFKDIGIDTAAGPVYAHVRDLWAHSDLGLHRDGVTGVVPSHDVVALRLSDIQQAETTTRMNQVNSEVN